MLLVIYVQVNIVNTVYMATHFLGSFASPVRYSAKTRYLKLHAKFHLLRKLTKIIVLSIILSDVLILG